MAFYPKFQADNIAFYQQYRLQQTVRQALSGLIKDIKRAGFLASNLKNITQSALVIDDDNQCIIIRYDLARIGNWRDNKHNLRVSDVFVYRYLQKNIVYRLGIADCYGQGWEKLFDNNEVNVSQFNIYQHPHYVEIQVTAHLTGNDSIVESKIHYVKTENL